MIHCHKSQDGVAKGTLLSCAVKRLAEMAGGLSYTTAACRSPVCAGKVTIAVHVRFKGELEWGRNERKEIMALAA